MPACCPWPDGSRDASERGGCSRDLQVAVDAVASDEENESLYQVGPCEVVDADEVSGTASPKNAWTASPTRIQESRGEDTRAQVSPHYVFEDPRVLVGRARAAEDEGDLRRNGAEGRRDGATSP